VKYIKRFNEELSNNFKNEVEMLFRDENLVCLIAKSQKAAHIYGYRTKWCNVKKQRWDELTFDHKNIVIFFMFKEKSGEYGSHGYKLRLLYEPEHQSGDWGDSSGVHILHFHQKDPFKVTFDPKTNEESEIRAMLRILSIPDECKEIVKKYLWGEKDIDYIKKDQEYTSNSALGQKKYNDKNRYLTFKYDTLPAIKSLIENDPTYFIDTKYDVKKNRFIVIYSLTGEKGMKQIEFEDFDKFETGILNIIQELIH
jgi:hypothetical protein